ncbi:MAG TPA: hypothetical protein VME46_02910 [Acidimicrobiales bacterium]|nr:hypothetical protein [Acidimicrobiales bacterium]
MGRLSIYLPDELEARVKALQPDTPTSQVIRTALERYIGRAGEPAYAQAPEDVADLLVAGVAHFADLAKRDYQDGYRAALKRLPDLDWHALAGFARDDFDIYKWVEPWKSGAYDVATHRVEGREPDWFQKVAEDLGSLLDPFGYDKFSFRHTPPWERGYADGLRAGYEAALGAGAMDAGGPATTRRAVEGVLKQDDAAGNSIDGQEVVEPP